MAESPETAKGETRIEELSRLGQTAARRVAESKATIPHIELTAEAELPGPAAAATEMIVRACGLALREHPRANGSYRDGGIELHSRVNVGVAMHSGDGLVVPTIFDADAKPADEIAGELGALAASAARGDLTSPQLAGGTFTLARVEEPGISAFSAAIVSPQAALLAAGPARERPVARGGAVEVAPVLTLTLSCDARVLDPAAGAAFLAEVGGLLEDPGPLARQRRAG